jgi:hypothetical protein
MEHTMYHIIIFSNLCGHPRYIDPQTSMYCEIKMKEEKLVKIAILQEIPGGR